MATQNAARPESERSAPVLTEGNSKPPASAPGPGRWARAGRRAVVAGPPQCDPGRARDSRPKGAPPGVWRRGPQCDPGRSRLAAAAEEAHTQNGPHHPSQRGQRQVAHGVAVGERNPEVEAGLDHAPLRHLPADDGHGSDARAQQPPVPPRPGRASVQQAEAPGVEGQHHQHPAERVDHIVGEAEGVVEPSEVGDRVQQKRSHQQGVNRGRIGREVPPPPSQGHHRRRQHEQREPQDHSLVRKMVQRHDQRHHERQHQRGLHPHRHRQRRAAHVQPLHAGGHQATLGPSSRHLLTR